ncbi:TetR/AcrR family transcriptional regulator [Paenibacillus sp. Lou8.1]|uniref:TetR/AcrR family transcriptional regulator n=1 Tax=Paenibacillus sp. Lou8.1 TaxID=2962041 RepID=UPI0020B7A942|nr:TetR/AcrR family transcriptional regulator [Paenibacillus sp. Lou8.1]MCP3807827.1 TetR/AcrR family transcriptional regulator [Paenibacillus sp. Lou8.1]
MYHIKDDKRSRASAQRLSEGLFMCLQSKDFSDISITDIQKAAGVGRATFYRLFDHVADILIYQCDSILESVCQKSMKSTKHFTEEIIFSFIVIWMENDKLIKVIVSANRMDILYEAYQKRSEELKKILFPQMNIDESETDYLVASAISFIIGHLEVWIKHNKKESAEELMRVFKKSILLTQYALNSHPS